MTAPPLLLRASTLAPTRGPGPLGWVIGGAAALAATAVAAVLAVLFAAALAVAAVLALLVVGLALAAAKVRGRAAVPAVITARWTGCGWDAG